MTVCDQEMNSGSRFSPCLRLGFMEPLSGICSPVQSFCSPTSFILQYCFKSVCAESLSVTFHACLTVLNGGDWFSLLHLLPMSEHLELICCCCCWWCLQAELKTLQDVASTSFVFAQDLVKHNLVSCVVLGSFLSVTALLLLHWCLC